MAKVYDKRALGGTASRGTASTTTKKAPASSGGKMLKKATKKAPSFSSTDKSSILATGNGPISEKTFNSMVSSGKIGVSGGKAYSTTPKKLTPSQTASIAKKANKASGVNRSSSYKPGDITKGVVRGATSAITGASKAIGKSVAKGLKNKKTYY